MQVSAGRHDNKLDCVVRCDLVKLTDALDPNPNKKIEDGEHRAIARPVGAIMDYRPSARGWIIARRREDGLSPAGTMMDYRPSAR